MKPFLTMFCILLMVLPTANSNKPDYTLTLPSELIRADVSEDKSDLAELFHLSENDLDTLYHENHYVTVAADKNNTRQVRFSQAENAFSKKAVSFSKYSDEELQEMAQSFSSTQSSFLLKTGKDQNRYICLRRQNLNDSGGSFLVTEYITVCSSKLYILTVSFGGNDAKKSEEFASTVWNGLSIEDHSAAHPNGFHVWKVLIAALVVVLTSIVLFLGFTVIRDARKKDPVEEINS